MLLLFLLLFLGVWLAITSEGWMKAMNSKSISRGRNNNITKKCEEFFRILEPVYCTWTSTYKSKAIPKTQRYHLSSPKQKQLRPWRRHSSLSRDVVLIWDCTTKMIYSRPFRQERLPSSGYASGCLECYIRMWVPEKERCLSSDNGFFVKKKKKHC